MDVQLEDLVVYVNGCRQRNETTIAAAGVYVLSLTTVLEPVGVQLVSTYVTPGLRNSAAAATHLWLTLKRTDCEQRSTNLAGVSVARAALLDHAAELQRRLGDEVDADEVRVDVSDHALEAARHAWPQRRNLGTTSGG
jgi:hypothetical protein